MKPLIFMITFSLVFITPNVFAAACDDQPPDSCYRNIHRKHIVKVNYQQPIIYCEYAKDKRGNNYRICHHCDEKKCVKEYYFDNYCEQDRA